MSTDPGAALRRLPAAADGGPHTVLKVPCSTRADYAFARAARRASSVNLPVYLSVGFHTPGRSAQRGAGRGGVDQPGLMARFRWLVDRVARDRWFDATVLPQLHVLAWGNERGV